jgi:hypothetical protein
MLLGRIAVVWGPWGWTSPGRASAKSGDFLYLGVKIGVNFHNHSNPFPLLTSRPDATKLRGNESFCCSFIFSVNAFQHKCVPFQRIKTCKRSGIVHDCRKLVPLFSADRFIRPRKNSKDIKEILSNVFLGNALLSFYKNMNHLH